jgi:hypothetical protein
LGGAWDSEQAEGGADPQQENCAPSTELEAGQLDVGVAPCGCHTVGESLDHVQPSIFSSLAGCLSQFGLL